MRRKLRTNGDRGSYRAMTDTAIEQWVLKQLAAAGLAGCKEVCVISRDGIVTLDGTVPSRTAKLNLQRAVREAKGVLGVINNLRAKTQPRESHYEIAHADRGFSPPGSLAQNSFPARAFPT